MLRSNAVRHGGGRARGPGLQAAGRGRGARGIARRSMAQHWRDSLRR